MDSEQYEELCRAFIAEQVGLDAEEVKSITIPNPNRPGLPKYKHQIDLYWETGDSIAVYLNVANAKWRGAAKVEQGEMLLLQQVRQKVAAHKAFMITNVGFTAGAVAVAKDEGIALHVLKPTFDVSQLPRGDRTAMQQALHDMAADKPIYSHRIEHRGLGFSRQTRLAPQDPCFETKPRSSGYQTRVAPPPPSQTSGSFISRSGGDRESRGGTGGSNKRGGGGIQKK